MAFQNKQRVAENAEQETDSVNPGLKRTTLYAKAMWLNDGGQFVTHKRNALAGNDTRVDLPSGHWIESKRTQARYLIGNGVDTRFNMDVKMETVGGGNNDYSLVSEEQVVSTPNVDTINIEWSYSHKEGATTYSAVFKTTLNNGNFQFQFTAPLPDTYRLFLQVTPVVGGVVSSVLKRNKQGQIYGVVWLLDTGQSLSFNVPEMVGQLNEVDTVLLGGTLFLYSTDFSLLTGEGFTLG